MPESSDHDPAPTPEEPLTGGGLTTVVRVGDTVRRPARPWTPAVAGLLDGLARGGLDGVPEWLGLDDRGRETLTYLPGEVGHYPLPAWIRGERALRSAARLLRRYHDATVPLLDELSGGWQFPALEPVEVICHGDVAPYNCVFDTDGTVVGLFDFDTARPGPRTHDLSYALYRFAPLTSANNPDGFGTPAGQGRRATTFLAAYGADAGLAGAALAAVPDRLRAMVTHMTTAAEAGDDAFARHVADGHADLYLADAAHAEQHLASWQHTALHGLAGSG